MQPPLAQINKPHYRHDSCFLPLMKKNQRQRGCWRRRYCSLNWTKALCFLIFLSWTIRTEGRSFFTRQSSPIVDQDPHGVLGVGRYASADQIKAAYRSKAKEWHPDKNPKEPEVAAQKFREIASAYEILSDPIRKRQYDNQLRREQQNRERHDQQRRQQQDRERRNRMQQEREAASKRNAFLPKARILQRERVVRITTIEDLEQIAFESPGKRSFKTNLLMVFVANKKVEKFVDDELLFPYIANIEGMEGAQDCFLPIKVRYNRDTDLTRLFQVPHYAQRSGNAYIVLGKKGQNPSQRLSSYTTTPRGGDAHAELEDWVTSRLSTRVEILNHHHSNVIIFSKSKLAASRNKESSLQQRFIVKPQWGQRLKLRLGDTILAMDSNVDHWPGHQPKLDMSKLLKLQDKVMLGQWRPWQDDDGNQQQEPIKLHVYSKRCMDWSTSCGDWMRRQTKKPCGDQPEFLHSMCAKSCGVCQDGFPFSAMGYFPSYYGLLHEPLSYWPEWFQNVLRFVRVFAEDLDHVWRFRKNAGFAFFLGGILLGWMLDSVLTAIYFYSVYGILVEILIWPMVMVGIPKLVYGKVLDDRHPFVKDMIHVIDYRKNVMAALVTIGFLLALMICWMKQEEAELQRRKKMQGKTKTD